MHEARLALLCTCGALAALAAPHASAVSMSLHAFIPICGGKAGQFAYNSSGFQVYVTGQEIALRSERGAVHFSYLHTQPRTAARGIQRLPTQVNFFRRSSSCAGLPAFEQLLYPQLYPGVSLRLQVNDHSLKSEYLVLPGFPPKSITIRYQGLTALKIDQRGDLIASDASGRWTERRPQAWQVGPDGRHAVEVSWRVLPGGQAGFSIGEYDRRRTLVIDPAVTYSTYLANATNSAHAAATGVAVDASGNSYVTGWTESNNLPTPLAGQSSERGSLDGFLIKCSPTGTILFAAYYGGSGYDQALAVAVDGLNRVWVTGVTSSIDLPLVAPLQASLAGYRNAFIAMFSSSGGLLFSSYFGGGASDSGNGIAADSAGNAYITGDTQSANFPLKQAVQTAFGGVQDAFIAKFSSQGELVYSTYFGGSNVDHGAAIAVDVSGSVYITGGTYSKNFPTRSPLQAAIHGVGDAFIAKLDSTGANIVYSTYLGGSSGSAFLPEQGNAIAVDSNGDAYVAGVTSSGDFPAPASGAHPVLRGFADAFVTELNPSGSALLYSVFIGGSGEESATSLTVGRAGAVCVAGYTSSPDFPQASPVQATFTGIENAFVTMVNAGTGDLLFSTVLGGSGIDQANGVAMDTAGNISVVGQAGSADFPLTNQQPPTHNGGFDAFAVKFATGTSLAAPQSTITYDIDGNGKQDLAVYFATSPGYQYSLFSSGSGSYAGVSNSPVNAGSITFDVVLQGDFNGDLKSDLLFYSTATGTLKVGLGDGSGHFTYAPAITITPGFTISRGDFNHDGKTDVLLYRQSDGAAAVGLSNGDGTFSYVAQSFSPGFTATAVGDYNGDGVSDVILYNGATAPYNAYLGLGNGSGGFTFSGLSLGGGYQVFPADLNADGKTDFVLYRASDGTVAVALSTGAGFTFHSLLYSPNFTAFKIGDVNGDGFPDLVLYNSVNANGYLLIGDGAGNFPTGFSLFFGPGMDFVELRDFSGDGKLDVLLYRTADGTSFTGISTGNGFSYTYNYFGPARLIAR